MFKIFLVLLFKSVMNSNNEPKSNENKSLDFKKDAIAVYQENVENYFNEIDKYERTKWKLPEDPIDILSKLAYKLRQTRVHNCDVRLSYSKKNRLRHRMKEKLIRAFLKMHKNDKNMKKEMERLGYEFDILPGNCKLKGPDYSVAKEILGALEEDHLKNSGCLFYFKMKGTVSSIFKMTDDKINDFLIKIDGLKKTFLEEIKTTPRILEKNEFISLFLERHTTIINDLDNDIQNFHYSKDKTICDLPRELENFKNMNRERIGGLREIEKSIYHLECELKIILKYYMNIFKNALDDTQILTHQDFLSKLENDFYNAEYIKRWIQTISEIIKDIKCTMKRYKLNRESISNQNYWIEIVKCRICMNFLMDNENFAFFTINKKDLSGHMNPELRDLKNILWLKFNLINKCLKKVTKSSGRNFKAKVNKEYYETLAGLREIENNCLKNLE